mmetsp:Transcript_21142/g.30460  ORF Transcript_21142/g.30460 Transcript_21142/m.30460 type:complete len:90 (+) Transcript_21142:197-466(+)
MAPCRLKGSIEVKSTAIEIPAQQERGGSYDAAEERTLYHFVERCRSHYQKRKAGRRSAWLSAAKVCELDRLGFIWKSQEADDCQSEFRI